MLVGAAASDRGINLFHVSEYRWILLDENGDELRVTDTFTSKEDAETWMGAEWSALSEEGAATVALLDGDRRLYEMGLGPG